MTDQVKDVLDQIGVMKDPLLWDHIGLIWLNYIYQHGHQLQQMAPTTVLCCVRETGKIRASGLQQ